MLGEGTRVDYPTKDALVKSAQKRRLVVCEVCLHDDAEVRKELKGGK
jgi:hypothetical protein